jgi:predicted MFS family arabinose efflux permease
MLHLGGSEHTGVLLSALGVGFLLGAPLGRVLIERMQPKYLVASSQTATAVGFYLLFHSTSLPMAVPAAVVIGVFGSIALVTPQTVVQRVIPNILLGRVTAAFFTAEALATLLGAALGPAITQADGLSTAATIASAATVTAAALAYVLVPRLPADFDRSSATAQPNALEQSN